VSLQVVLVCKALNEVGVVGALGAVDRSVGLKEVEGLLSLMPADEVGEAIAAFNKKLVAFGIPVEVAGF
jgi:hypothetical protein